MTNAPNFYSPIEQLLSHFATIINCRKCRSAVQQIAKLLTELIGRETSESAGPLPDSLTSPIVEVEIAEPRDATAEEDRGDESTSDLQSDSPLLLIEKRCRLKARACRWLVERQSLSQEDTHAGNCELFAHADDIPGGCYLWMMRPNCPKADNGSYHTLAMCFDVLADAVQHLRRIDESCSHGEYVQALTFAAESQKLVRQQMPAYARSSDEEQLHLFGWLRKAASPRRIYLPFMKAEDKVASDRCVDLGQEIAAVSVKIDAKQAKYRSQQKLMKKLSFQLARSVDVPEIEFQASVFRTLVDLTDNHHLPPSNVQLRTILVDHVNSLPSCDDHAPASVQAIYEYLANYLETIPEDELSVTERLCNDDVRKVASLIEGRSVILIGGIRKPTAESAIREAFRLGRATWIESQDVSSYKDLKAAIDQPEVCLVLHLTRFSQHISKIPKLCKQLGKPYVRVTGGYNPNNIARNVLEQVGQSWM